MENQQDKITKRYNELSSEYKDPVSQSGYFIEMKPIEAAIFDRWVEQIQQRFQVSSDHYLLDVGCGSGIFLKHFSKFTDHLYGVDPAEGLLKSAKENCPEATLRAGTVEDAEFGDIKFHRIFCNSVFLYLDNLDHAKKVIIYFMTLTTKDAKIWLGDLAYPNPAANDENYRRIEKSTGWALQHYPIDYLGDVCKELGLKSTYIKQDIEGKPNTDLRYDFLIERI